jgi:hypothetical protein
MAGKWSGVDGKPERIKSFPFGTFFSSGATAVTDILFRDLHQKAEVQ